MTDELTPAGKPKAQVPLVGEDGNAFAILGRVSRGLRATGHDKDEVQRYHDNATSGDYDHLLQVTLQWADDTID